MGFACMKFQNKYSFILRAHSALKLCVFAKQPNIWAACDIAQARHAYAVGSHYTHISKNAHSKILQPECHIHTFCAHWNLLTDLFVCRLHFHILCWFLVLIMEPCRRMIRKLDVLCMSVYSKQRMQSHSVTLVELQIVLRQSWHAGLKAFKPEIKNIMLYQMLASSLYKSSYRWTLRIIILKYKLSGSASVMKLRQTFKLLIISVCDAMAMIFIQRLCVKILCYCRSFWFYFIC